MYDEYEIQKGIEAEELAPENINDFFENYKKMLKEYDRMEDYIVKSNLKLSIYHVVPKVECYR